jgi:hypothetical protein
MSTARFIWIPLAAAAALICLSRLLSGQGIVNTQRPARPSPQARTTRPVPKVDFEDVAAASGLKFQHVSGDPEKAYIVEAVGSGAAVFD